MTEIILFWSVITIKCMLGLGTSMLGGFMLVTGLNDEDHILIKITCVFGGLFAVILGIGAILLTLYEYGLLL